MDAHYDQLVELMTENGLGQVDAERAARNCGKAMARSGYLTGTSVGLTVGYFTGMNPLAVLAIGTSGAAAGAFFTLANAPSCLEVRRAASFWLRGIGK